MTGTKTFLAVAGGVFVGLVAFCGFMGFLAFAPNKSLADQDARRGRELHRLRESVGKPLPEWISDFAAKNDLAITGLVDSRTKPAHIEIKRPGSAIIVAAEPAENRPLSFTLMSNAGSTTLELPSGKTMQINFPDLPPGAYTLGVNTQRRWVIAVAEDTTTSGSQEAPAQSSR